MAEKKGNGVATSSRRHGADDASADTASSVVETFCYALASARQADEAAACAAAWVREAVGPKAAVQISRPDAAGRLRAVWREGEEAHQGRAQVTARRVAFQTRVYSHLDLPAAGTRAAFFPLVWRETSLGVLEIQARRDAIRERSGMLAAVACQLAGVLAGLAERDGLEREVEALEGVAGIGRDILHADGPEVALRIVAGALWREFRAPVAIWWGDDHGPRVLTSVAGLNPQDSEHLAQRMGAVLPWARTTSRQRADLSKRFADAVGASEVTVREAGDSLVFVANDGPLLQRRVEMIASLLDDTLPLLSASAREDQRTSELHVGLAWTAHELRTPILGVKAALESVVGRSASRDEALLRLSVRELEQLATDTEGILGWAVGGRELSPRYVDVAQLVEDAVATYRLLHGAEGTVLVVAPPPIMALADPTHLRAAVVNLVRNAVLYSDPEGVVSVHVTDEQGAVRVSVGDQGPGVPLAERGVIFDPFVRGGAGSRAGNGSGLGLFITRRVVEAHGGRIWVDSDEGGATFHMLLPVDGRELQRSAS
jgi:signal transduction histidine kinase